MTKFFLILTATSLISGFIDTTETPAHLRVEQVMTFTAKIETLSYDFIKSERISNKMIDQHLMIKMQREPFKVYLKEVSPNPGVEILFPYASDPSKALINPNGFPWINLKLDPLGNLMRHNQHHTILDSGFDYILSILNHIFDKYQSQLEHIVVYDGTAIVDGRDCEVFTMTNPRFQYVNYTVLNGEDVSQIADKFRLNEYMILHKNPQIKSLSDVKQGDLIKIPNDYSSKMTIYVDRIKQVPLRMEIYDDDGLFEKYEFRNVKVNLPLAAEEFSATYTGYGF